MNILKAMIAVLLFVNVSFAQNFSSGKITAGFHFNSKNNDKKKFDTGFLLSACVEPRVSNSGNLVFNFGYGRFKIEDTATYYSNGLYSLLAGFKQKFFYGRSDINAAASVGMLYGGFGFELSLGNELVISRSIFLSADVFYGASITTASGDGGNDKPSSVYGVTAGIGLIH